MPFYRNRHAVLAEFAETKDIKRKILDSEHSKTIKQNILKVYEEVGTEVFGYSRVVQIMGCSEVTATAYLKRMERELNVYLLQIKDPDNKTEQ